MSFGISLDNMQASDIGIHQTSNSLFGVNKEGSAGLGVTDRVYMTQFAAGTQTESVFKVTTAYGSSSTHDYSFHFESSFSTSDNPELAGHPSDVIIGGGVDIVVGEATQGN